MYRMHLVRSVAPSRPDKHSAKVIELRVRREARNDPRPHEPAPDRPRAA
jgi:hypothetical protein